MDYGSSHDTIDEAAGTLVDPAEDSHEDALIALVTEGLHALVDIAESLDLIRQAQGA